jgi:SAM-dependent methyltransferase
MPRQSICRLCGATSTTVLDMGKMPLANSFPRSRSEPEETYDLVLESCAACGNLQLRDCIDPHVLYENYLYVTPNSRALDAHYASLIRYLIGEAGLSKASFLLEIGSNVGDFLWAAREHAGRTLGIDPAASITQAARERGVETITGFFDADSADRIAREYGAPDVIVARHMMAHNEQPHDLIAAARRVIADGGLLVVENNYAGTMIEGTELDQIYHEHMFYYSLTSLGKVLARHDFSVVDVFLAPVHGGSIVCVARAGSADPGPRVGEFLQREHQFLAPERLLKFADDARAIAHDLHETVAGMADDGRRVFAYGASAKCSTLLNFAKITHELIPYCADSTPVKVGRYMAGSGVEVISEQEAFSRRPDAMLLTAWNFADELVAKARAGGLLDTSFILPIPRVHVYGR